MRDGVVWGSRGRCSIGRSCQRGRGVGALREQMLGGYGVV